MFMAKGIIAGCCDRGIYGLCCRLAGMVLPAHLAMVSELCFADPAPRSWEHRSQPGTRGRSTHTLIGPSRLNRRDQAWGRSQIDRSEGTCMSFAFRDEARPLPFPLDVHLHRVLRRTDRVVHDVRLYVIPRGIIFFCGRDAGA
jgi:hypothetical protein